MLFLLLAITLGAQAITVVSWNIRKFGKSRDNQEINMIADVVKHADIILLQEVVAKDPGGAKAVARLANVLNQKGSRWDYRISDPTRSSSGNKSERYAFLWQSSKLTNIGGRPRLISELSSEVEREPYLVSFRTKKGKEFTLLNYHACTHKSHFPERDEITLISNGLLKQGYNDVIWAGDMNLEIDDVAFSHILNTGYKSLLNGEKTSLKKKCKNGNYLSSAEDNVLYRLANMSKKNGRVIDFVSELDCNNLQEINLHYSDHLPLEIVVE
jgi:endonuclease/exonuclease/phosphatase family metal-dependent hydrolase